MQILDRTFLPTPTPVFLSIGFRPFFFVAGGAAMLLMMVWSLIHSGQLAPPVVLPARLWHGHEMVFGYCLAVIAGFVLTATTNWTGMQTLRGPLLFGLVVLWLAARVSAFINSPYALWAMAAFDLSFMVGLILAVLKPIWLTKSRQQFPVVIKLVMMMAANFMFYLGALRPDGQNLSHWGLYLGFYLILSLIMMMGRRVIPFFIQRASTLPIRLTNWKWLDLSSMFVFLAFMLVDVFTQQVIMSALFAGVLFVLHLVRLINWYHPSIFRQPLLWVLYVAYAFIVLGFALKALTPWLAIPPWLSLHAFAVGGMGMMTLGMMARVALGHTGRNVMQPSPCVGWLFLLLAMAAVVRVLMPLLMPAAYALLVFVSQGLWMMAFLLFVLIYLPVLFGPDQ